MPFTSRLCILLLTIPLASAQELKINAPDFSYEEIHSGNGMTALDFDDAGRMFVCEKQGRILVFNPKGKGKFGEPGVFADFRKDVDPDNESGLLGNALDPDFASNRYLYVFYTTSSDQRLVRLTADDTFSKSVPGSELVLLSGLPRAATNHKAGDIHFHPKDPKAIYLTLGDDTKRELASDLGHFHGKLLRVNASDGKGLPDNPFYDGDPGSVKSRVWARGFRNPFRFAFVPGGAPDFVFVSENGDSTDRIAAVKRGADAGWGRDGDKGLIDPADRDTRVLFTSRPCMTAIAIAPKGPFAPDGPVLYAENWFTQELQRWNLEIDPTMKLSPVPSDGGAVFMSGTKCVDSRFCPDGSLYLLQAYFGASEGYGHKLGRVVFVGKN